ncbi:PhoD-like phosphatase-domain-containing protein [Bombardia bombarda]|uniref:PhoD-like phosphatase-domain-containing protein n=1 Tax=Bombardia bombarda TaxID=252184 RepID=A0AA40BVB7_9PEZI|nr:PhoD-like phosphatase-domain-containing protein [Bombardia bombarda]
MYYYSLPTTWGLMALTVPLSLGLSALRDVDTSFDSNLNYRSPSGRHTQNLGIDVPVVSRRTLKRSAVPIPPSPTQTASYCGPASPPSAASDFSNVTVEGTVEVYSHETDSYIKADPNPICVEWKVWEAKGHAASDIQQAVVDLDQVRLAVFSCSNYPNGYFNAYGNAARKGLQDYVQDPGLIALPETTFSLWDYRTRHGQLQFTSKSTAMTPDLQLLAKDYPWITTWDDHEVANNGYRDGFSALNNTEESFLNDGPSISVDQRKMNAVRAYFEWMPIRSVPDSVQ